MRIAILYASVHHKNTEKLVKAISEKYPDITLIDTTKALMISLVQLLPGSKEIRSGLE